MLARSVEPARRWRQNNGGEDQGCLGMTHLVRKRVKKVRDLAIVCRSCGRKLRGKGRLTSAAAPATAYAPFVARDVGPVDRKLLRNDQDSNDIRTRYWRRSSSQPVDPV